MILDLWSFLEGTKETIEFEGNLQYEGFNLNGRKIEILEPIEYKGQVFKVDGDKVIHVDIDFIYGESCNRCLNPTENKVRTLLFGKLMEGRKDFESMESEDDSYENILYYENSSLNLHEYIIEQVSLSLPMKTICKDNCKGLCPKCGIDLNKSQCDCNHEDIDPRLEKLKDFFPKI